MIKKVIGMLLAVSIVVGLTGCNSKDSNTAANAGDAIRFACLNLNKTDEAVLNIAVQKFKQSNLGAQIEVIDYAKKGYDSDKYIKTINTELMAGNGPDIMPVTYLPVPKYIAKNIFLNLTEVMEKDNSFDKSEYFGNILDACKYNGAMYAFPIYFNIRTVVVSKDALDADGIKIDDKSWTLDDFIKIAEEVTKDLDGDGVNDRYAIPTIPMEAVAELFISTEKYINYEKSTANFNSKEFIDLLNLLKIFEDKKLTNKELSIYKAISYKDSKATVFSGGDINGYRGLLSLLYMQGGGDRVLLRLPSSTKSGGETFDSKFMLAVNNKSKFKDYDWKFIKLLASKEIQNYYAGADSLSGFPIYRKAFDNQLNNVMMLDWRVAYGKAWIPITISTDQVKFIKEYIDSINSFTYNDSRINNIVIGEIGALFKKNLLFSSKDAESIANGIQKKVNLYLEE